MVIKKKNFIEILVIYYLIFMCLFSPRIGFQVFWNLSLFAVLLCLLYLDKDFKKVLVKRKTGHLFFSALFLFCFIVNITSTKETQFLFRNIRSMSYSMCIVLIVSCLFASEKKNLIVLLRTSFSFFNLVGVANLIVLTLQEQYRGFLMPSSWMEQNSYYPDLCAGLFGFNGTHDLTSFFSFLVVLNMYTAFCAENRAKRRTGILIYTGLLVLWMMILSTKNDNIGFIVVVAFFVASFIVLNAIWEGKLKRQSFIRFFITVFLLLFVTIVVFSFDNSVGDFINDTVLFKINKLIHATGETAMGSDERLAIVRVAFGNGYAWTVGLGLGSHYWTADSAAFLGFSGFGQNSISSFITLGGVGFYMLVCIWYSWVLWTACNEKKDKLFFFFILISIIVLSIYTIIFINPISMFWYALIVMVFIVLKKSKRRGVSFE